MKTQIRFDKYKILRNKNETKEKFALYSFYSIIYK